MIPEGLGDFDITAYQGGSVREVKAAERYSSPQLKDEVGRANHVYQTVVGDVGARNLGVAGGVMLMIKSVALLAKEFFQTNFTHLAAFSATMFTTFYAVGGVKMVIDGSRECRECLRTTGGKKRDVKGAMMTGNRVTEGGIMIGIGSISLVASTIYLHNLVGLRTPLLWVGDLLVTLSSLTFGVYTLFEWLGSFLESRKFRELRKELNEALGPEKTNYQEALRYLKSRVVVSDAEKKGLSPKALKQLTRSKEDLFSLFWGRELMLNVRDLRRDDPKYLQKAEAIVKEAIRWNAERVKMVFCNFMLFTFAVSVVVACFALTGGLPVIAGALVMSGVSLTLNVLNTRRIFMYWKSKEIGRWDETLLIVGMVLTAGIMTAAISLTGAGPYAIAIFAVTGALILTLKAVSLYKLHHLIKERKREVEESRQKERYERPGLDIEMQEVWTTPPQELPQ